MYSISKVYKKTQSLERSRRDIGQRLDKAYLRDNISDFLALEDMYRNISIKIEKLNVNSRRVAYLDRTISWNQ